MSTASAAQQLLARAAEVAAAAVSGPADLLAAAAALVGIALVVASSFVKTMIPLRWLAVGSNVAFLVYGVIHAAPVILLLHTALLPINVWRAVEMVRLTRRVTAVTDSDLSGVWLKPYMRRMRPKAGEVLFRKGDIAAHLYFLADGQIEFVEIGEVMDPGRMFGEIAFFAPDRQRTLSARCRTDCIVLAIDEDTFRQVYFQEPAFGFRVASLLAGRLLVDRARLDACRVPPVQG